MVASRRSLSQLPIYLGPEWNIAEQPIALLTAFLRQHGGSVDTSELKMLYNTHPQLKPAIGKLEHFVADQHSLIYKPRSKTHYAVLSLRERDHNDSANGVCESWCGCFWTRTVYGRRYERQQQAVRETRRWRRRKRKKDIRLLCVRSLDNRACEILHLRDG